MPLGVTYNNHLYTISCLLLTLALAAVAVLWLRKSIGVLNLMIGAGMCWLILLLLTSVALPGASYLFAWPLLFSLLGLGYCFLSGGPGVAPARSVVALTLAVSVAVVLSVPVIYHLFVALPLITSGAVAALAMLLLGLLVPQLDLLTAPARWLLPALLLLAAVGCATFGLLTSGFDQEFPRPDSVFYGYDTDTGKAYWASIDDAPDSWTEQFFQTSAQRGTMPAFLPQVPLDFMQSPVLAVAMPAPVATLLEDKTDNGVRILRLRVTSSRQAPLLSVYVEPQGQIIAAAVNGKLISDQNTPPDAELGWGLNYFAPPQNGIELRLETKSAQPLNLRVVDSTYGLPQGATHFRARTDDVMPNFLPFTDSTLVSKAFKF
jgi:hypothetical protein